MELIADILLVAGALGAGLYCFVLARRLKRFTDLEKGVGGAVSVLSAQADELKTSLDTARTASDHSAQALSELTQRAESVAQRLELMMASMHDLEAREEASETGPDQSVQDHQAEDKVEDEAPLPDDDRDDPPNSDETAADASSPEPAETPAPVETAEPTDKPEAKAPEGVMFFRHAPRNGASPS